MTAGMIARQAGILPKWPRLTEHAEHEQASEPQAPPQSPQDWVTASLDQLLEDEPAATTSSAGTNGWQSAGAGDLGAPGTNGAASQSGAHSSRAKVEGGSWGFWGGGVVLEIGEGPHTLLMRRTVSRGIWLS